MFAESVKESLIMIKFDKKSFIGVMVALAALVLNIANCISNIIVFNVVSLAIDFVFVAMLCFALGYIFCRAEIAAVDEAKKKAEKGADEVETPYVAPTDKDLTEL